MFFGLPNFKGVVPQKLYLGNHPYLVAHHVEKFHKATPSGSKDLAANMLNFKPILAPL